MDRFTNILVTASPGHLEPMTLLAAVKLADANNAQLTVIDVMAPVFRLRRLTTVEGRIVDVQAEFLRHREERLRHLVDNTGGASKSEVKVLVGEPFIEVIRHVLAYGNDLVMVGGHEVHKWDSPDLATDVMHLLRKCPVPVWVMRPTQEENLRVLALVDPDRDDPVRDGLNDLVMELATSLSRRTNAELHVGHAWEMAGEGTFRSSPYIALPGEIVDVMVTSVEASHREQLDLLMERHAVGDLDAAVHLVAGDAGNVLPRLAEGLDVGLIVMGTVARTGLSGLIMGNTAETILRAVRCSVLAVKPAGFVTPVKLEGHAKAKQGK